MAYGGKSQLRSYPTSKATPQTNMFLPKSKWKCLWAWESAGNGLTPFTQTEAHIRWLKCAAQKIELLLHKQQELLRMFSQVLPKSDRENNHASKPTPKLIRESEWGAFHMRSAVKGNDASISIVLHSRNSDKEQTVPSLHGTHGKGGRLFAPWWAILKSAIKLKRKQQDKAVTKQDGQTTSTCTLTFQYPRSARNKYRMLPPWDTSAPHKRKKNTEVGHLKTQTWSFQGDTLQLSVSYGLTASPFTGCTILGNPVGPLKFRLLPAKMDE